MDDQTKPDETVEAAESKPKKFREQTAYSIYGDGAAAPTGSVPDPAKSAENVALERMAELVQQHARAANAELTDLRDQLDEALRGIERGKNECIARFEEQARVVQQALAFKGIVADHLAKLNVEIKETLASADNSVLTAIREGRRIR